MKRVLWCLATVALVWLVACDEAEKMTNQNLTEAENQEFAQKDGRVVDLGWIPDGAEIHEGDSFTLVKPPKGWNYIAFNQEGELHEGFQKKVSINCSCKSPGTTGGCYPFVATGQGSHAAGCVLSYCDNCIARRVDNKGRILQGGGYVNPSLGVELNPEPLSGTVFPAMTEMSEFNDMLDQFYIDVYGAGNPVPSAKIINGELIPPAGHMLFPGEIMGRSTVFVLPQNDPRFQRITRGWGGTKAYCSSSCNPNACVLVKKGALIGKVYYCEGACSQGCTLTVELQNVNGQLQLLELISYDE